MLMIDVKFIAEHGPYKAGTYSQFHEEEAKKLVASGVAEALNSASHEPPDEIPADTDSARGRKSPK